MYRFSSLVTGTQHYVKFTSEDTGRSLIIPLAGSKGDKSSSNNPAFGKRAVLWTNERNGLPGGYAWAYWLPFEGAETAVIKKQRLQMEAFASVRCVKK
ncbi:fibrobacter succinogenes major paralogous domain-containing protein [Bacteroides thetaiotaomicron]|nr:fibrobacter succinogenes major paralogous domain-containing protein [Bacteroides thetaiotaomicron]MDC2231792.1 fibrobacter succinogenes major paralogous domain-containing protein [Bacteroides thetaiotaomicron]MDO6186940.1 fibrobacter succinogenes major paralogous domain-containing protein [Bacteroides thetaiotaomicron]MDO6203559.1 fibrobacter succinogenes major paralogous domain-containing protein [Bacteroides thetaiotaomicron]MDO6207153.1 fibrobacter succinogenes major paralogous domain-con